MNYLYNETNLQNGEGYVGSTNHEPHPNSKQANGAHFRARWQQILVFLKEH